ncbi:hypothetical protein [Limnoglobus roseus]|uniref:Glycosyltransferase RgtA/B/C/D-like domain-containing protein n=1 Tax=Limnoglobus roseus TaxID=2598579 RepID=A0A5C1AFY8_9BACT|nr:hypothetical protein [Limnoglobus roseus]QEL16054.1 hypothetical protein PX52LOC_02993 [Limnoglobus roseus]
MTTPPSSTPTPPGSYLPWRWEWLGWALAAVLLVIGVPLFLRMPPWCDLTLYEMAARTMMTGGVHYRDVFDTNLPGFVWLLVAIRRTLGPSTEAVRVVDLAIVTTTVVLLLRLARWAGANRVGLAWMTAGAAALYPFTTEFCHAQRDVWMFLPALAAVVIRLRRTPEHAFAKGFLEGLLWASAVWIKPHVVFPAAAVWLFSARRVTADGRWKSTVPDFLGNLSAGVLLGAAGIAWLVGTGTWPYFVEVFTAWNPHYTVYIFSEIGWRFLSHPFHFVPWMFFQPLAIVLSLCDLAAVHWGGQDRPPPRWLSWLPRWLYTPASDAQQRMTRAMMGALFLSWLFQSFVLQRQFPYAHVAETLLTLAIFAAHRWAVVPLCFAYLILSSMFYQAVMYSPRLYERMKRVEDSFSQVWDFIPCHALVDGPRLARWPDCWKHLEGAEYARRQDQLALLNYPGSFPSISVEEAEEVAAWFRARGATAEDVVCWHSSPHAIYLGLTGRPAFRFMHVDTPLISRETYAWMRKELVENALPKAKYVVSDLYRFYVPVPSDSPTFAEMKTAGDDLLPVSIPVGAKKLFPCNQPAVFRSGGGHGRYIVHELKNPIGTIEYDTDVFDASQNINFWTR